MELLELLFKFLMLGIFVSVFFAYLNPNGFVSALKENIELLKGIFPVFAIIIIALFFLGGVQDFLGFEANSIKPENCTYYRGSCLP
jgi:hypothetical protein